MPRDRRGNPFTTAPWSRLDGFSTSTAMITYLEGASLERTTVPVPGWQDMARSLDADAATALVDATTRTRLPHFAELDYTAGAEEPQKAFMIWPSQQLEYAHRYVVAIRNIRNAAGDLIPPSDGFRALRDGTPTDDPEIEGRRALYEELFAILGAAGVQRADLQIAWDFTTGSLEYTTGWMTYIRDDATARIPADGPRYRILSVQDDYKPKCVQRPPRDRHTAGTRIGSPPPGRASVCGGPKPAGSVIARYISGAMTVPHYMTNNAEPGSTLVIDGNNRPVYQVPHQTTRVATGLRGELTGRAIPRRPRPPPLRSG